MSTGRSSRTARMHAPGRRLSRRTIVLAAALGVVLAFAGLQEGGRMPGWPVSRMSVPVAEAAAARAGVVAPTGRDAEPRDQARLGDRQEPGSGERSQVLAAAIPPVVQPELLFDPSSLIATAPKPRVAVPEMALRSDTILPAEPIAPAAAEAAPAGARASAEADAPGEAGLHGEAAMAATKGAPARGSALRLAGTWAADRSACSRRNSAYVPIVIDQTGARAGSSACRFGRTRQTGNRWTIAATCRNGQETWAANVRLLLEGTQLTWTSERGTERYRRCP